MKTTIILMLTFFGLTSNVFASPISPYPLRQLVLESQHIIVGYVVKTFDKKKYRNKWGIKVARIAVLENLQGNIKKDSIDIEFQPNILCPAPARYFDRTFVISFICKDEKREKLYTYALNYGSKTLEKDEIEIYKQRISEIQQILKITNAEKQRTETIEWLVKCAENETTRFDGTWELRQGSFFMTNGSQYKQEDFKNVLNINQKERLKKILLTTTTQMVDFGLVDLVYSGNEQQIDDFLFAKLKNLEEEYFWVAEHFMNRLKHKNTGPKMDEILKEFEKFRFEYEKKDQLKKTIENFIKLIEE